MPNSSMSPLGLQMLELTSEAAITTSRGIDHTPMTVYSPTRAKPADLSRKLARAVAISTSHRAYIPGELLPRAPNVLPALCRLRKLLPALALLLVRPFRPVLAVLRDRLFVCAALAALHAHPDSPTRPKLRVYICMLPLPARSDGYTPCSRDDD